jgi:hypothetical protein
MMPMSQIDMVILKQDGSSLQVCGGLEREDGKEHRPAQLYVVVRKGDVIATGPGTCDYGNPRWQLDVHVPEGLPTRLQAGPAIACGVAIVEEDPAGLEAFSWVQQVEILARDPWTDPPPIDFKEPELATSATGQLDAAQAIASSLTITPSDGGRYRWAQEVEIRPVE